MDQGRRQAKVAGEIMREHGLTRFGLVLTSPLRRAAETCTLAGFEGELEPDLMEWDYGDYEGLTTAEIRQLQPGWSLWEDGVPAGERVSDVGRRADRVLERVGGCEGDVLCFAHGHLLRVLAARWLGLPPVAGRLLLLRPGAISVLGWDYEWPAIEVWNRGPD